MTVILDANDKRNFMRKMNRIDNAGEILRPPMQRSLLRLQNRMAAYPPPPPGSLYRRTGTLGRKWTTATQKIDGKKTGIVGRIGNNVQYGPRVQSAQFQARVHRGRWQTDEQVASEETGWIRREFDKAVTKETKKR